VILLISIQVARIIGVSHRRQALTVILSYLSLLISDVEHLFIYLLIIYMSSLENVYSGILPISKLGFFVLALSCVISLYIVCIDPFIRYMI
jgi:hypothetical protein